MMDIILVSKLYVSGKVALYAPQGAIVWHGIGYKWCDVNPYYQTTYVKKRGVRRIALSPYYQTTYDHEPIVFFQILCQN